MKHTLTLLALLIALHPAQARKLSAEKLQARAAAMGDCLKKLIAEGKTGFATRRGARLSPGEDGAERYATPPMDCFDADDQYISVKDGKAIYTIELSGETSYDILYECMNQITERTGRIHMGLLVWTPIDLYAPKDGWDHVVLREDYHKPALAEYRTMPNHRKTVISVGPVTDYEEIAFRARIERDNVWNAKQRTGYKPTGNAELDSINLFQFGTSQRGDYVTSLDLKNFYAVAADNYYNNTVGEAYTAPDGSTRYRAPLWFGADAAYYRKDTSGWGTMLYLFFAAGKPHTEEMLATLRRMFSYDVNAKSGKPGPHEFVYLERGSASNIMYRYDVSPDAAYKGITVAFYQSYKLAERIAAEEAGKAQKAKWDAYNAARDAKEAEYRRAHPQQNGTYYDALNKQRDEDQARKDKLHQESVDYYNKIHPYDENSRRDRNNNVIH